MERTDNDFEVVSEKLSRNEREVSFIFNEGEGVWYADTSIPKWWRRLESKNWICINTQYYSDGTVCSKMFKGSKKGVTITDPFKVREVSDEQREAARERFMKMREKEKEDAE